MDSKMGTFWMALLASMVLWLVGGFMIGHEIGMICVILGITITGVAAGRVMDTPCTTSKAD